MCYCNIATCDEPSKCSICGYVAMEALGHDYGEWTFLGSSQHRGTCRVCRSTKTESCVGGKHPDGRCIFCHGEYQMHKSIVAYEPDEASNRHYVTYVCSAEGCSYENRRTLEDCYGYSHDNGGRCVICSAVRETHNTTTQIVNWDATSMAHTPLFACSALGCKKVHRGTTEQHVLTEFVDHKNGTHVSRCTVCNYNVTDEHDFGTNNKQARTSTYARILTTNSSNQYILTAANYNINPYAVTVADEEQDVSCTVCGALASDAENGCEHSYVEKSNETQHWEECTKCGYYKQGSLEPHEHTAYTDNGDGTHSDICTKCGYKITKDHYFEDGICVDCGANALQECEHSYELKNDETKHWVECSKCNQTKSNTIENHEFTNYYDNKDGTHTAICTICNYKLTENHAENCEKCKNTTNPDDGNEDNKDEDNKDEDNKNEDNKNEDNKNEDNKNEENNGNKNDNENKDNTIIDKIFPNTGVSKIVVLAIIALVVTLGVVGLKLKKYKGI